MAIIDSNLDESLNTQLGEILETTGDEGKVLGLLTDKKESILNDDDLMSGLPHEFRNAIREKNGGGLKLVIEKEVTMSDTKTNLCRFLVPLLQANEFLEDEERATLETLEEGSNKRKGINLQLIQPSLEVENLCLKLWPLKNTFVYALIGGWNRVVKGNSSVIKEGAFVRLYAFRVEGKLWMALIPRGNTCGARNGNIEGASGSQRHGEKGSGTSNKRRRVEKASGTSNKRRHVEKASGKSNKRRHVEKASGTSNKRRRVEKASGTSNKQRRVEKASRTSMSQRCGEETSGASNGQRRGEEVSGVSNSGEEVSGVTSDEINAPSLETLANSSCSGAITGKRSRRKGIPSRAPFF